MSISEGMLLKQAQAAIRSGRQHQARQLLAELLRENPHHVTGWLWLAGVTPSAEQAARYVTRAEMLQPDHPTVIKARAWVERRLQTEATAAATPRPPKPNNRRGKSRPTAVLYAGLLLVMLTLLAGAGWLLWPRAAQTEMQPPEAVLSDPFIAAGENTLPPTPTPTAVSQLAAKQIAQNNEPRATWTVTPTPSPTPTPTPTAQPTFVSPSYTESGRPLGVSPAERWIDVNLTTQTLTAYEGDTAVFSTLISSGTQSHPTVTGQFRVWLRYESQTMNGRLLGYDYYLENVPYVMYFFEDYALHGAYWHNNFGAPMSHGCVNMDPDEAAWLFNWSRLGTVVNVHH